MGIFDINTLKFFANKVLPTSYDDSLSYYEVLGKVTSRINDVITATNALADSLVEEYDPLKNYEVGDYVWHNNSIWKCTNNTTGSFNTSDWGSEPVIFATAVGNDIKTFKTLVNGLIQNQQNIIERTIAGIAAPYDNTAEYEKGDYVSYISAVGAVIYKCKKASTNVPPTNTTNWESVIVVDELHSYVDQLWSNFIADYERTWGIVQTPGDSEINAMSQRATTQAIINYTDIPNRFLGVNNSAVETIFDAFSDSNQSNVNIVTAPYIMENKNEGVYKITKIKINSTTNGTLLLGAVAKDKNVLGDTFYEEYFMPRCSIEIESGTHEYNIAMYINDKEDFALYSTDVIWKYGSYGLTRGFHYISNNTIVSSNSRIGIKLDGEKLESNLAKDVTNNTSDIELIKTLLNLEHLNDVYYNNGYSDDNTDNSNVTTKPFIIPNKQNVSVIITSVKAKFVTGGTVSYGTISKELVVSGATFDPTTLNIKGSFEANAGLNEYETNTFIVKPDEYMFLGIDGENAVWKFGTNGVDKTFYYVPNGTGVFTRTSSSIGVDIMAKEFPAADGIRFLLDSTYAGKSFSFLGDSITTYAGYIPTENTTYYPSGDITAVDRTWWMKLIKALGGTLNTNNSWSGSRVTNTGSNPNSAGSGTRCQELGISPDVIIVFMGINDFNSEIPLGTYDGTTPVPVTNTTFREAYGMMLDKILTAYKKSEVFVCTLMACERNAETGFPEINGNGVALSQFNKAIIELADAFGVKIIPLHKCGLTYQNMDIFNPNELHPNQYGHSLMANEAIKTLDNTVALRYPIE